MFSLSLRLSRLGAIACLFAGLLACGRLPSPNQPKRLANLPVNAIETLTPQTADTTVTIRGRVGKHAPFLNSSAYEVQDDSGSLWVVTTQPAPASGTKVLLKGQVRYQSIPLAGKEVGEVYLEESEILQQTPPSSEAASPQAQ